MADQLAGADDLADALQVEAAAAVEYFSAWRGRVSMSFAARDARRVPSHWKRFWGRRSPLAAAPTAHQAADPINALLNYLYALAEAECRLACLVLGLDAGIGFCHADVASRDSLALDLLEVVRPEVDAWMIDVLEGHVFRKSDFVERPNGHVRVLAPLTHRLASTMQAWSEVVAPYAEGVAHRLAEASDRPIAKPTSLTSRRRRATAIRTSTPRRKSSAPLRRSRSSKAPKLGPVCQGCGVGLGHHQRRWCGDCWPAERSTAGRIGSGKAKTALADPEVRRSRGRAISEGKAAAIERAAREAGWDPDDWEARIRPTLAEVPLSEIMAATGLGIATASGIRTGRRRPHPRHWAVLARVVAQR